MKKFLTIILVLLLTFIFSGCKNKNNKELESFPESSTNNTNSDYTLSDFQEFLEETGPIVLPPEELD